MSGVGVIEVEPIWLTRIRNPNEMYTIRGTISNALLLCQFQTNEISSRTRVTRSIIHANVNTVVNKDRY